MNGASQAPSQEQTAPTAAEIQVLRRSCTRFLHSNGYRAAKDYQAEIPTDSATDVYGMSGVVDELERQVASILGKPSAAFCCPSMGLQVGQRKETLGLTDRIAFQRMQTLVSAQLLFVDVAHGVEADGAAPAAISLDSRTYGDGGTNDRLDAVPLLSKKASTAATRR